MFYFSLIKGFLTSRIGLYVIAIIFIVAGCFVGYKYIFNQGYEKAKSEYNQALVIELEKQKKLSEIIIQKAQITHAQEEKIKIVYKDRIKTIEKIVEKPIYKECVMSNEDYDIYKKSVEEVKWKD